MPVPALAALLPVVLGAAFASAGSVLLAAVSVDTLFAFTLTGALPEPDPVVPELDPATGVVVAVDPEPAAGVDPATVPEPAGAVGGGTAALALTSAPVPQGICPPGVPSAFGGCVVFVGSVVWPDAEAMAKRPVPVQLALGSRKEENM